MTTANDPNREYDARSSLPPAPSLHQSFRFKLVLLVGAVIGIVATAVGLAGYRLARSNVHDQIEQRLEDLVDSRAALVRTQIRQLERQVNAVVSGTRLRDALARYGAGRIPGAELRARAEPILRDARAAGEVFRELAVATTSGRIVIASDPAMLGADVSGDAAFEAGRSKMYLGQPVPMPEGGFQAPLVASIRDQDGQIVGILFARVNVTPVYRAVERASRGWTSGEVLIAARHGEQAVRYLFSPPLEDSTQAAARQESAAMARALRDEAGHLKMVDYRGRPVLAAYGPVDDSGNLDGIGHSKWGIVAKVDADEAYAPVERMRDVTIVIAALLGLVALGVTYRIARRFTEPIGELAKGALTTAADPSAPIAVPRRKDEIGVLAAAFGHMRRELIAHQSDLEDRVADRTSQLSAANQKLETQIAERARMAEELKAAMQAAEASNRAKSAFLAAMSHEIRTPMNGIVGMAELLAATPLAPIQREYLGMVQESAESLLQLINDILDFSRMEAGRFELEKRPFELRELIGNTVRAFADRAHNKGLELAWRVEPEVADNVIGDPLRVRQVLVNLVGNAIKFTDSGEVVVEVASAKRGNDETLLQFEVRDTGIGIPTDRQQAVFEAFEQADVSSTRRFGGAGLGLTISARLVNMMGGKMRLVSAPDGGSTFHFSIPVQPAPRKPTKARSALKALEGTRVLVVDDNQTNCRILDEMLRQWSMQPTTLRHAGEALGTLLDAQRQGKPFDIALIDANMPDIDGFTLATQLRSDDRLQSPIVMMLSSADRPGDVQRCKELGVDMYLLKPLKQSDLLSAIQKALGLRSAEPSKPHPLKEPMARLRILVAEDNRVSQRLATELLGQWGHEVLLTKTGAEALQEFESRQQTEPVDIVLMDVQMPEMDGFEATRQIRAWEQRQGGHVPIVAMTAHAMKGDKERCLKAGMDGYLVKPLRAQELRRALQHYTSAHQPQPVKALLPPGSDQVIDWRAALERVERRENVLRAMAATFVEECPNWLDNMDRAVSKGSADDLHRTAHTIKGAAQSLAAERLARSARDLEAAGRERRMDRASTLGRDVHTQAEAVVPVLQTYLSGKSIAEMTSSAPAPDQGEQEHAP